MLDSLGRNRPIENEQEKPRQLLKLLIPVGTTRRSRWPIRHALARPHEIAQVDLLAVAEPIASHQLSRFRTERELADLQHRAAKWLLEHAAEPLQEAGVSVARHLREGDVVIEIVEAAEQLGSDAIVLPAPRSAWMRLLSRGIVREVMRRARVTPVLIVNREGQPVKTKKRLHPGAAQ